MVIENRNGLAVLIDGNVDCLGLHDPDNLPGIVVAFCLDDHADGHRGSSNSDCPGVEADHIPDKDGRDELDPGHGDRDEDLVSVFACLDCTGQIKMAQNDSAKNGADRIGVTRKHRDSDCQVTDDLSRFFPNILHNRLPSFAINAATNRRGRAVPACHEDDNGSRFESRSANRVDGRAG